MLVHSLRASTPLIFQRLLAFAQMSDSLGQFDRTTQRKSSTIANNIRRDVISLLPKKQSRYEWRLADGSPPYRARHESG